MHQSCKIRINIRCVSKNMSKSIIKSLGPDNIKFPKNLMLQITDDANLLTLDFTNNEDMGKLINTIDEVLAHIQLIIKVINDVRS